MVRSFQKDFSEEIEFPCNEEILTTAEMQEIEAAEKQRKIEEEAKELKLEALWYDYRARYIWEDYEGRIPTFEEFCKKEAV